MLTIEHHLVWCFGFLQRRRFCLLASPASLTFLCMDQVYSTSATAATEQPCFGRSETQNRTSAPLHSRTRRHPQFRHDLSPSLATWWPLQAAATCRASAPATRLGSWGSLATIIDCRGRLCALLAYGQIYRHIAWEG